MKRIVFLILIATTYFVQAFGQETSSTDATTVDTLRVATTSEVKSGDTVIISEWEDTHADAPKGTKKKKKNKSDFIMNLDSISDSLTSIIALILIFGLPFFVVFIAFYFRYKNRKARYRLIEKALDSGKPLPKELLQDKSSEKEVSTKGIKNICLGVGLFIFLWAITGSFGVGCIGVLIMCIGVGQLLISRLENRNDNRNDRSAF